MKTALLVAAIAIMTVALIFICAIAFLALLESGRVDYWVEKLANKWRVKK